MENQRLVFTISKEMHAALRRQSAQRGATQAGLMRIILGDWLKQQGEGIGSQVEWGGVRKEAADEKGDAQ